MNFSEMQENLSNWISEDKDTDGTWTIAEKERQLNDACLKFVMETQFLKGVHRDNTVDDQRGYTLPDDIISVIKLTVNGVEYVEESFEEHFFISNGITENITGPYNYFYIDEVKKTYNLVPSPATTVMPIRMLYIKEPNKLVDADDVSTINKLFHAAPVLWAAYQMLPKEFEQGRRGREALAGWKRALDDAHRHINAKVHDNVNRAQLGPEFLPHGGQTGLGFDRVGGRSS